MTIGNNPWSTAVVMRMRSPLLFADKLEPKNMKRSYCIPNPHPNANPTRNASPPSTSPSPSCGNPNRISPVSPHVPSTPSRAYLACESENYRYVYRFPNRRPQKQCAYHGAWTLAYGKMRRVQGYSCKYVNTPFAATAPSPAAVVNCAK
ncbi:MAG: hypothetical protein Greene041662_46 [Candidatus Peregrinibacteria bacterium Greene0416_62]|nr:MAG: hypothetical protein Greene041662_46 [Candidatus Peregrinibacteria bacterium Greene0416_62]